MHTRTYAATGFAALVMMTACSTDAEPPAEQVPATESHADAAQGTETDEVESAAADEAASATEDESASIELPEVEGIELHDEPGGVIAAPNGAMWQHHGTIGLDDLDPTASAAGEVGAAIDCHEQFSETSALWLRQYNDGEGGDYLYDEYGEGAEYGPTCFADPGGSVAGPEYRLIHYICQSANTTSRTLIAPAEGGEAAWTPEYTTEDERACFTFDDGAEVRAYQTEVTDAA